MIRIENVCKKYNQKQVLKDIDFSVLNTEFLVILGPSGSGKSTLLRLVSGLEVMDSGRILIDGQTKIKEELIKDTATTFQGYSLFPNMNVYNNIGFPIRKEEKSVRDIKIKNIAKLLKIEHLLNRKVTKLSGGEAQRVSIGRALIRDVNIYLFDEPLSSLDQYLKQELISEIKSLHDKTKKLFIYVTHNQEEAKILGTKILVLNEGRVEAFGSYNDLYNSSPNLFTANFLGELNIIESNIVFKNNIYYVIINNELFLLDRNKYDYNNLKNYINKEVVLGIRPEDVIISNKGVKVKVDSFIDFPLYKRYNIKLDEICLKIDSNLKKTKRNFYIDFNNIMIFDKQTLQKI